MALIRQVPAPMSQGSRIPFGPDYEREAEDARLKLRGGELLADSSRLYPTTTGAGYFTAKLSRSGLVQSGTVSTC